MSAAAACRIAQALIDRARSDPDRVILWDRERALTYAQLDALVGTLAADLKDRRDLLGPTGLVPMVVGRDVASAVAVHAALRAGVGFVPIDASLPPAAVERLLARVDDPRLSVVTSPDQVAVLPHGVDALLVPHEAGPQVGVTPVDPDGVAMITFTSGSSGEPKGVVSPWWVFDAYWTPMSAATPVGATDYRAVSLLPPSFAAGVVTLLRPAFGAAVSIIDPSAHDPMSLLETFDRERLNLVVLVPSLVASVMSRWPTGRKLDAVDTVLVFGEPLEWPMVETLRSILPEHAVIVNSYGATETVVIVAERRIDSRTPIETGRVPLGWPVTPGRIRLEPLSGDPDAPTEMVVVGEIAAGYWRDDDLTSRSFGQDPDGTRYWRSGDLARIDETGQIHFVGRRDNVVKINGRLVEPSEPERVLGGLPGIRRAVVLVQDGPRGASRLVAHVEIDADSALTPSAVRAELAAQVAGHLVPAVLVRHERLPEGAAGKIDRQALMTVEPTPWHERSSDRSPTTFETALLDVAAGIVGNREIGPDDDLWDAGLDSLGATELLATLQDFGWPAMPESVLLEHRSAAALDALRSGLLPTGDVIWLDAQAGADPVVCVLPPSGDALTFRRLAQEIGSGRPVAIVRQFDPTSANVPLRSVDEIVVAMLDDLGPRVRGRAAVIVGYSASGVVAYEVASRLFAEGNSSRAVLLDAPAGAATDKRMRAVAPTAARRMRTAARQAWLRALPPVTLPQRERAYALFELATRAAERHVPSRSSVPTTLFRAARGEIPALADSWSAFASDLAVVDLDCDHTGILGWPHVTAVADRVRASGAR